MVFTYRDEFTCKIQNNSKTVIENLMCVRSVILLKMEFHPGTVIIRFRILNAGSWSYMDLYKE